MRNTLLTERYQDRITGVLGCFDRIVITGSLPDCCHVDAMKTQLLKRKIWFFTNAWIVGRNSSAQSTTCFPPVGTGA